MQVIILPSSYKGGASKSPGYRKAWLAAHRGTAAAAATSTRAAAAAAAAAGSVGHPQDPPNSGVT